MVERQPPTDTVGPLPLPSEDRHPPGAVIGDRYEIQDLLGSGGHGTVFRAFDREVRREVALKLLRSGEESPNALSRLRREIRVARDVESPRLVRIFDLATSDEGSFLTMEVVEGPSLREALRSGPLPVEEAVRIASHVLEGLAALHGLGIVHRDVKPGNILLAEGGAAKLADFGLSYRLDGEETRITKTEAIVGTLGYLAPEQSLGKAIRPGSDLYAAGLVLFEMLAGRLPHEALSEFGRRLSALERAPDVRRFRPEVPPWLAHIVARLLEVRLADRYPSAEEVLRDLRRNRSPRRVRLWRNVFRVVSILLLSLPPLGVVVVPTPEARFSRLIPTESGIAAVGRSGERLWQLSGVEPEIADRMTMARLTPGGPRLLALVRIRPGEWSPEKVSTLSFLDPATGKVVKEAKLPSGKALFPNDPPRFDVGSVAAVDLFHDGVDEVLVSYRHVPEAPSYVVLYAPQADRARIIFYARGGHSFQGLADLDGDGAPELLFAGINNGWNWVNAVAAVRLEPWPWTEKVWEGSATAAPDRLNDPEEERNLLWYAVIPRGHLQNPSLTIDENRRLLTVQYNSGKTWVLDFEGFPKGTPPGEEPERQVVRRETYAHLREAERLRKVGRFDLAMPEAAAAFVSAVKAREAWLSQYAERLQAKILIDEKRLQEAEALFASLAERAEDAPEVAYDAAVTFHLAGDLSRAVTWYERGLGRNSAAGAGKSKHEFLKGEVLALVEEKRYEEAQDAVNRFGSVYPAWQNQLWLFRGYIDWRSGKLPEIDPAGVPQNWPDLERYWALEFDYASGGDTRKMLSRVDRFLAERPETRPELLSLRAELLSRLGRRLEAAQSARNALEMVHAEEGRSIVARGHEALLSMRASRLAASR